MEINNYSELKKVFENENGEIKEEIVLKTTDKEDLFIVGWIIDLIEENRRLNNKIAYKNDVIDTIYKMIEGDLI